MASQLDLVRYGDEQVDEGGIVGGVDGSNSWDRCQSTPGLQSCKNPIFDETGIRIFEGLIEIRFMGMQNRN